MSSPRIQKLYQGLTEQLRKLGPYPKAFKSGTVAAGRDSAGRDAVVVDLTSPTWASGNLRVVVAANPASDAGNTAAFKTQSHASGHYLDGSVSFDVYMETPADHTGDHAKFLHEVLHALRGQLGAPMQLWLSQNGDDGVGTDDAATCEPRLSGLNGATNEPTGGYTSAGTYQPYFFALPGGV